MIALITGGTGQLGQALLASVPQGWKAIAPDRSTLDLADPASVNMAVLEIAPDLVINAGAYTAVDKAESEPELAHRINAEAPRVMAEALKARGKGRLLQVSTDFVFDGSASRPYQPDDLHNPLSVYGQTKSEGEAGAGADAIILRTSWVYTAGGGNFVRTMLRLVRERDELRVVSDQRGAPSWAPDIARTIWGLAEKDVPGVYHHSDAGQTSWHGFAQAIAEDAHALGMIERIPAIAPIPSSDYPTLATRPAYSVLDSSKTRALLGDEASPWRDNLKRMLKEERALG